MSAGPPSPSRPLNSSGKSSSNTSSGHSSPNKPYINYNSQTDSSPFPRTEPYHIPTSNVLPPLPSNGTFDRPSTSNQVYRPLNVKDALSYLDQVKVKFSDQPEVYNRFLDIMKEFKSQAIDTPGVIERVSSLFRGHPTLISGFNTFLPPGYRIECSVDDHARDVIKVTTPSGATTTSTTSNFHFKNAPSTASFYTPQQQQQQQQVIDEASRRPPIEFNHAINYVNKIKNRFANDPDVYKQFLEILQTYQKEQRPITEVYSQVQILFNGATDLLSEFKQFLPDTTASKRQTKRRAVTHSPKQKKSKTSHSDLSDLRSVSYYDEPVMSAEETEFFERVRKYIGNKTTYYSFLKVLNLFCRQILDQNTLIERCESFLSGNKELFHQLKTMVGYQTQDKVIENVPTTSSRLDIAGCPECGPSYRSVPKSWQKLQKCTGRDDLCKEVLNDQYVSHPTWASEDGGFIASKKNIYEESLHRVEEERYDYDMNIEANLNTISLLEPISKRISSMSEEEKKNFKLPIGLGGPSQTIYQRIIKKIYGKEQGAEVIDTLHNHPAQAVPIILKRLKQKDEEWRKAQREWNKVWREIEIKNYYKALDYQGVNFKVNDRKTMSVKALVTEIEAIRLDQEQESGFKPQFVYEFKDKLLFKDVARILFSYFERQTIYGSADCEVMKAFIEMFLPVFFDVPDVKPEKDINKLEADEEEDVDEGMSEDESFVEREKPTKEQEPEEKNMDDEELLSIAAEPMETDEVEKKEEDKEKKEMEEDKHGYKVYTLFGNTPFYCFFRLFQMAYDRLGKMKQLDKEYQADPSKAKYQSKAAVGLGINHKIFQHLNLNFKEGYYKALLKLIDHFFDDELDQQTFEECARYIFGTKAYMLFSIDKLMQSITRQLHHIVSDTKAQMLLSYFKQHQEYSKRSVELTNAYLLQVIEALDGEDEAYNLTFNALKRTLSIQILLKDDEPFKLYDEEAYNEYVNNYTDWEHETLGVDRKRVNTPFLKRNIQQQPLYHMKSNMEYKICRNTYHLFYVIGTEDSVVCKKNQDVLFNEAEDKNKRFQSWLNNAFLVPSEDAHQSEIGSECDLRREWISGFSGSAGFAIVTLTDAYLFTDGRYFLQAEEQLDENWTLFKQGLPDVPTWQEFLIDRLPPGSRIGMDSTLITLSDARELEEQLKTVQSHLIPVSPNPVDLAWGSDRPQRSHDALFIHTIKYAGEAYQDKLNKVHKYLFEKKYFGVIVSALDEIAWLFNLRGSDVDCSPVFYAYALITQTEATLYVQQEKLTEAVHQHLQGVQLKPYGAIFDELKTVQLTDGQKICIDENTSMAIALAIGLNNVVEDRSYINDLKAIKNERELKGMRDCHIRDGAALVQFFAWLEQRLLVGEKLDEVQAADHLEKLRASQQDYVGLSFPTISSSGPNGAIIHYEPKRGQCRVVDKDEIYLCDSGAQYKDGTTDVTRTFHFGQPTAYQKTCFTAVLQGHIALDTAVFPPETSGYLLNSFARMPLWKLGLDYRHGTGHGVGSFLHVHEGPHGIGTRASCPLAPGMTVTDEPGYYEDGQFGIRIENVLLVRKASVGDHLEFEHVTMVPIGINLIDQEMLSPAEKQWINHYHAECFDRISPLVAFDPVAAAWLKKETRPI
ncbi:hypothetical protein G6F37_004665 [Rhizopus arrhizus]|nr:hypothetical protein G6F38_004887 [Rhizopus arrhizus]KAG1159684.1 hypothetical protein G6F37_004665 [Rhizopus arrhizus]